MATGSRAPLIGDRPAVALNIKCNGEGSGREGKG